MPNAQTITFFDFKDPIIRRAIHALKYYHRKDIAIPMAAAVIPQLKLQLPDFERYTLVPIPMPRLRKLFRGYNQAELIALELSTILGIPVRSDILHRIKNPSRQVTLKAKEDRARNQKGSFASNPDLSEMNILLVDDVTTTGATLSEARNILLKNGAGLVTSVTLAH